MSSMQEKQDGLFERLGVPNPAPEPPRPPAVPSPYSLVDQQKPRAKRGLFEELLGRDHLVLYQDLDERPDLYDEPTRLLIEQLAGGNRRYDQLDDRARQLLDVAATEFATNGTAKQQQTGTAIRRTVSRKLKPLPEPNPTASPESAMPPFWWLS